MSIVLCVLFFTMLKDQNITSITTDYLYCWALFSIADALWVRWILRGK